MKRLKQTKGITLVALVVTIIVLLILAGISIQAITNTGIFTQANNAKRESEIANIKEQIALDIYEKQLEPPLGSITDEQLETILGKYGTVNKEDGTIVGITTEKGYEILLKDIYGGETVAESIPDGAVVTPINDITTWIKTAEISKQYSYTTIEQVIADSTCIESLMNNENAMKYLSRSTEFADAICASETAMMYLGDSAYADDTVLNSDIFVTAICNSEYFESVLNVKVPTMTSNTEPSGEVFVGSNLSSYSHPYAVFDDSITEYWWQSVNYPTSDQAVFGYTFPKPVKAVKFYFHFWAGSINDYYIQGSNDKENWETIYSETGNSNYPIEKSVLNHKYYSSYRIYPTKWTTANNMYGVGLSKVQIYGR